MKKLKVGTNYRLIIFILVYMYKTSKYMLNTNFNIELVNYVTMYESTI